MKHLIQFCVPPYVICNIVVLAVITRFTVNSFVKKKCYSKENWEGVCVP